MAKRRVKEKDVQLIELFYDLIYVYAVSRMTPLMEHPAHGVIAPLDLFRYLMACLTVLQCWLYMTNYSNRYGQWRWYEYGLMTVNMIGAMYLANTLALPVPRLTAPFSLSMLVMLGSVAALYAVQLRLHPQDSGAARNSLGILLLVCAIYGAGLVCEALGFHMNTVWLNAAAVVIGAFLPFVWRGHFSSQIISFPHLCERFEELTIICFGQGVVEIADYFDVSAFSVPAVLAFLILICLFGCYVLQIHHLVDQYQVSRSLRLMFSHYLIVLSIGLMTVSLRCVYAQDTAFWFLMTLTLSALVLFFAALFSNSVYYADSIRLYHTDWLITAGSLVLGAAIMIAARENEALFLAGMLCPCLITMIRLWKKDGQKEQIEQRDNDEAERKSRKAAE